MDEARTLLQDSYERILIAVGADEVWTEDAKARLGRLLRGPQ
jgi:hypothetical protein